MSEAPFKPGDKVVRIGESWPEFSMYKGSTYTVEKIWYCCPGAGWRMDVLGDRVNINSAGPCIHCNTFVQTNGWCTKHFVKLDDLCDVNSILEQLSEPVREVQPV